MVINKDQKIFFGSKIDSKLREALATCKPGDRKYFEGDGAEFLCVLHFGDEKWIGKVMKSGMGVGDVEDIQRNVVSILRRIAPEIRTSGSSIKVFPVDESQPAPKAEEKPAAASGGGGPYIDY